MIKGFFKYLWYVIKHKYYVMIECFKMGLFIQGITHDMSKFLPSEFFPYMRYFNPETRGKKYNDKEFDYAWLKHQNRNKHHWQYWILVRDEEDDEILEMPDKYWKEMISDWIGAGKALGFKSPKEDPYYEVRRWYLNNLNNIKINFITRKKIERELMV